MLYINHYEIKELRKLQQEEIRDKADYNNYRKQQSNGQFSMEVFNRPEIFTLIQQLIMYMQRQNYPFRQGGQMRGGPNMRPRINNGQPQGPRQPMNPIQGGMPPAMPQAAQPGLMPAPQQQPAMRPPMPTGPIGGQLPMISQSLPPFIQEYLQKGYSLLPAVVPQNPNYKAQVGEFIYEYVEKIAGEEMAPKITGMLIDLPIEEIKGYLVDFGKLQIKVNEAKNLLTQQQ
jgi:hypothetical protein